MLEGSQSLKYIRNESHNNWINFINLLYFNAEAGLLECIKQHVFDRQFFNNKLTVL